MRDPYVVLGARRDASADDLKQAYRKLAKQHHPDLNPGDAKNEARFKEITAAYDLLSDAEKRRRYDAGEIDAQGSERPQARWRASAGGGAGGARRSGFGGVDPEDLFDLFSGGARRGAGANAAGSRKRGADVTYSLSIDFVSAAAGAKHRLTLPDGRQLDVAIPAGTLDGAKLRLKGQGQPGPGGAGDAFVEIHVEPHAFFRREGDDVLLDLPIGLHEAVLGAKILAPTIDGKVAVTIPKGSNQGTVLRLRGKGLPKADGARGDQLVRLVLQLPDRPDPELERFVERWAPKHAYDPRKGRGLD